MVKLLPSADPEFADLTDKANPKVWYPYLLCRADVISSRGTKFGVIDISGLSCISQPVSGSKLGMRTNHPTRSVFRVLLKLVQKWPGLLRGCGYRRCIPADVLHSLYHTSNISTRQI